MFRAKSKLSKREMLDSRPTRLSDAEPKEAGEGKWTLKVALRPTRVARFLLRVPAGASKTFELDELGLFVWQNCDGRTPVRQVIRRLAKKYQLSEREAEVACVQFLHTLTKKGLIGMQMKSQAANP